MKRFFTILASLIVFAMSQSIQTKSLGTVASSLPGENDKPSVAGALPVPDIGYIYKLTLTCDTDTFVKGEIYIGKHIGERDLYFSSGKLIRRIIKKHGKRMFLREVICPDINDPTLLSYLEVYYIEYYKCNRSKYNSGLNLTSGGEGLRGYKFTEEAKREMSEKLKAAYVSKKRIHPYQKTVYQYSLENGDFIREYEGCSIAALAVEGKGTQISICAGRRRYSAHGFGWSYERVDKYHPPKRRGIEQYDKKGNFIAQYDTLEGAAIAVGTGDSNICNALRGDNKTAAGFVWKYKKPEFGFKCSQMRTVYQYSNSGNFIAEHKCTASASRDLGISRKVIKRLCEGRKLPIAEFDFSYSHFK